MKIDEGVNGKIHAKVRQMLNSKAISISRFQFDMMRRSYVYNLNEIESF